MIYILLTIVALTVGVIIWSLEKEEREEQLKGQLTKKQLREIMKYYKTKKK